MRPSHPQPNEIPPTPLNKGGYNDNDDLSSEKGINYEQLRDLLKAGKWKEAGQKTSELMLQAMEKESWWDVSSDDLKSFPKTDLRTMDQLWLKYSEGKFGFSVQKQIWLDCGGQVGVLWLKYSNGKFGFSVQKQIWLDCGGEVGVYDYDIYWKFADQVQWLNNGDWLSYDELNFTDTAIKGHLPVVSDCQRGEVGLFGVGILFPRF